MRVADLTQDHCTHRIRIEEEAGALDANVVEGVLATISHDDETTTIEVETLGQTVTLHLPSAHKVTSYDDRGLPVTA